MAAFARYESVPNACLWSAVLHIAPLGWEDCFLSSLMRRSLYQPVLEADDGLFYKADRILHGSSCHGSTVFCHQEYTGLVF